MGRQLLADLVLHALQRLLLGLDGGVVGLLLAQRLLRLRDLVGRAGRAGHGHRLGPDVAVQRTGAAVERWRRLGRLAVHAVRQRVLELGELLEVGLPDGEQHDEEHHEQRDHVGISDQPALVVLVLLMIVVPLAPGGHVRLPSSRRPLRGPWAGGR